MKIYACSNWGLKFLGMVIDAWKDQGHDVEYSLGYDPELHRNSDVCYIDTCDNNAIVASANRFEGSRLVIRAIDIECWVGNPGAVQWANVDGLIFGARHIQELVSTQVAFADYPHLNVQHVPFGVDRIKWTYKDRQPGYEIAFVAHRWSAKGIPLALQVMAELGTEYTLHFLGDESKGEKWNPPYVRDMLKILEINATFEERVDDLDAWLEDKNYLLVSSQKEAFSYVAAEAAAKGIKPIIHSFYGAYGVWPLSWIWSSVRDAVGAIEYGGYDSEEYAMTIQKDYSLERMMQGINEVCEII